MSFAELRMMLAGAGCTIIGVGMFIVGVGNHREFFYGIWAGPLLSLTGVALCVFILRGLGSDAEQ